MASKKGRGEAGPRQPRFPELPPKYRSGKMVGEKNNSRGSVVFMHDLQLIQTPGAWTFQNKKLINFTLANKAINSQSKIPDLLG